MQANVTSIATKVRLSIPMSPGNSAAFKARVGKLLGEGDTHVYIDTSFLMWATKIGPASRSELLDWLRTDLGDRAHVPTWAAHEYLRHHVARTIVKELDAKADELSTLVGGSFSYFRPFLDDPALDAAGAYAGLRASAREAIHKFARVINSAKDWHQAYPKHSSQVIEYINERVLEVGGLYDDIAKVATVGAARYEGRIPPGFRDRHKGGASENRSSEHSKDGANRYGDLIFWKEALEHAKKVGANAVILLTNDRKNDWRMGGESSANIDSEMLALRKSWRPVPLIHPMLALEAKTFGIKEVALLDSQYLAAYLRDVDEKRVASFVDVAIVPDPPSAQTESERRKELVTRRRKKDEREATGRAAAAATRAAEDGFRFADDPALIANKTSLTRALLKSRNGPDERGVALLEETRSNVEGYARLPDILNQEAIAGMDQNHLARMARGLHDCVLNDIPGYEEALADLGDLLPELPLGTASALTLGLMASMYLESGTGTSRIPPRSPISELLLKAPREPYGELPAQVIAKRLSNNDKRPLHIPLETKVDCSFETDSEAVESDALRSLRIAGVETLLPAQDTPALSLNHLLGGDHATGAEILRHAAMLFGLPTNRLCAGADEQSEYLIPEGMGFKDPKMAFRAKEEV